MLAPYIDPHTGDFVLENGNIVNRNALLTLSYTRLKCPRGLWRLNPNFGNPKAIT